MDDREDPARQFFPGEESVDLYAVLSLTSDAKLDDIKKAYRRLALAYHPDKQTSATETRKAEALTKFQQIGFAYAVLSDDKRRQRYDKTGKTDEGFELGAGDDGWEAYFEELFDRVTRGRLDEMKKDYQGSAEEVEDLKSAYVNTKGSIEEIMTFIPHSNYEDEARFIVVITDLIAKGDLPIMAAWESSIQDEKSKLVRRKQGEKEAEEAEQMAKELGVWEEFYGSGKPSDRKTRGKGKGNKDADAEEDHSALQALILKKQKKSDSFFDSLAAKYAEPEPNSRKGKKRSHADSEVPEESPKKRQRGVPPPPDIDDAEFEKLQQKLFGNGAQTAAGSNSKGRKGKKAK